MRVKVKTIMIGELGTVLKAFKRGLKELDIGLIETIRARALLRLARRLKINKWI